MAVHKNIKGNGDDSEMAWKRETAINILQVLQRHRRIRKTESLADCTIDPFIELAIPHIKDNKPFKMLLVAFHCKSINPDSVFGNDPDGAAEVAVKNLEKICEEIKAVYPPGCELLIIHEGHFYADIGIVPNDKIIENYENGIHKMTKSPMIKFTNIMEDFSPDYNEARKILFDKYMMDDEAVKLAVYEDQFIKNKYVAYKTFITHEFAPVLFAGFTKPEIKKASKALAYKWIQRYLVFRDICAERFTDYFRLNALSYPSRRKAFSINLIPDGSEYGFPWFHVLVKNADGSMELMKKIEAEKAGYKLIYKDDKPWYFVKE